MLHWRLGLVGVARVTFDRGGYDLPNLPSQAPLRPRNEINANGLRVSAEVVIYVPVEGGPRLPNDVVLNGTPYLAVAGDG